MIADIVDRAFLHRLSGRTCAAPGIARAAVPVVPALREPAIWPDDPVVTRLLAEHAAGWSRLAEQVEMAWSAGERVVAVAGRSPREGRSTIVRGLVHVLRGRGLAVTCREAASGVLAGEEDDDALVIFDAGVWFPPGPVHRGRLAQAALGCHAAVLVRRAQRPPCPAHEAALVTLGIHLLGEVETFAEPASMEITP